jgi:hypothetical protein
MWWRALSWVAGLACASACLASIWVFQWRWAASAIVLLILAAAFSNQADKVEGKQ